MAALSTIAMAAMAGGAVLSAASAIEQGQIAAKQASMQADLLNQQAQRQTEIAKADEDDYRRQMSREQASRRAILGGSGVVQGEGSPLLVSEDMAGEIELQARRIRNMGEDAARNLQKQGALVRWGGQAEKRASYTRAGASLLSGIGSAYSVGSRLPGQKPIRTNDSGRIIGGV